MTTTTDEIWRILAQLAQSQKETDRQLQETARQIQHLTQEIERVSQEIKQVNRESDRKFQQITKKVDQQISAVNKQISALGGKWGHFVENMVAPSCETIFLNRGIDVHQVSQRVKKKN